MKKYFSIIYLNIIMALSKIYKNIIWNNNIEVILYNTKKYRLFKIPPKTTITSNTYYSKYPYVILDGMPNYGNFDIFRKFIFQKKIKKNEKVFLKHDDVLTAHPTKYLYMYQEISYEDKSRIDDIYL